MPRFRLLYLSNWTVNEENLLPDGTGYVEFLSPEYQSSIRVGSSSEKFSAEGIAKNAIQEIAKTFEEFQLIDEGPLNINGMNAYDIFLTYKHPSKGMIKNEYIFVEANDKLYTYSLQDTVSLGEYIRMATAMLDMVYSAEFGGFGLGEQLGQKDFSQVNIIFKRSECFGTCPYYSLNIFGKRTVIYNEYKFVKDNLFLI